LIYLILQGGAGNQFFQYAFARAMQEKTGEELIIDFGGVENNKALWKNSGDVLPLFNTKYNEGDAKKIIQAKIIKIFEYIEYVFRLKYYTKRRYYFILFCSKIFNRFGVYYFDAAYYNFPISKTRNKVIKGYFESARYFEEIDDLIKNELTPRFPCLECNLELYNKILTTESVCISIKRRDINNPKITNVYTYDVNYFYNAVNYLKSICENLTLFVFSDDVDWCKDNLDFGMATYYESGNDPIWEKIRLMSSCKHFIIHNSTFSWWAQHLSSNPNKIVIAPPKWMQRNDQPIDIYEQNWIYMDNNGDVLKQHK
jgi:hypothetical protein